MRHTKVPTLVFKNAREVDRHVALVVESLIRENNSAGLRTVLGLADRLDADRRLPRADSPASGRVGSTSPTS